MIDASLAAPSRLVNLRGPVYLGDFAKNATIKRVWGTNDRDGGAANRTTAGSIVVYRDANTSETTAGVTDTATFDSTDGLNLVAIATTDSFYRKGSTYTAVLKGAVIDGQTVNWPLAIFGVERVRQ